MMLVTLSFIMEAFWFCCHVICLSYRYYVMERNYCHRHLLRWSLLTDSQRERERICITALSGSVVTVRHMLPK